MKRLKLFAERHPDELIMGGLWAGYLLLLVLTPWLHGCTDERGPAETTSEAPAPTPGTASTMAPVARITFPGTTALLTAGHVTVRGTAHSEHAIASVK